MNERRADAAEAFVRALRTGENSAVTRLKTFLAPDAELISGKETLHGAAAVAGRVTGQWALTPVFAQGEWTAPAATAAGASITGTFPTLGAAPQRSTLEFAFDDADRITRITETVTPFPPPAAVNAIPPAVATAINTALANGTPFVVAYTGDDGAPVLSLRGSVQVYGPLTLCLWVRNPQSNLVRTASEGKSLSLLYRNSAKRMTISVRGRGEVAADDARRQRVFGISTEVEQRHDLARHGVAVLVHIERLQAMMPGGVVLVTPAG